MNSNILSELLYHVLYSVCDIYCTSVRPRKKAPSSVVVPEVSFFPCLGYLKLFLTRFEGLRAEDVISVKFVKA